MFVNLAETIVIKDGNVFGVCDRHGSLPAGTAHPLGVYLDDCRFLSTHQLRIGGAEPLLLVASDAASAASVHEMTNDALVLGDGRVLPLQALELRLERRITGPCELEELLHVRSHHRERVTLDVSVAVGADFAPMLSIRGIVPAPDGAVERLAVDRGVRFSRLGADGVTRATTVTCAPAPDAVEPDGTLRFRLALGRSSGAVLRLLYELDAGAAAASLPPPAAALPAVRTDDELFDRILRRSLADVRMLRSSLDGRAYCAAGVPWYATLFGRDSLITATQMLAFDRDMAEGTLRLLAELLGREEDPSRDEAPGKILHELRVGEVANLGLTPLARYYGTVDATPLFLCLLADHADWTGDLRVFRDLREAVDAALGWMETSGDANRDGLLDYRAGTPDGLVTQGWKDSVEGALDEYGVPLEPPVTLIEPQAYAIRARRRLARLFERDGDPARAGRLREAAAAHAALIERFWLEDRGCYSMGWGADGRPSRALASNQGHVLWSLALRPDRARAVRDAVMSEAMFSGWGIRTLAEGEAGYNPVGYHLGTVWPHDTVMTAWGLRRYGFDADFQRLFDALIDAAAGAEAYRLPELLAGFPRTTSETPVPYPAACRPQAWAAGALPSMLTAGLGLVPDGLERRLRIRRPSLPRWVDRVDLRGLRVADAEVDLRFERVAHGSHATLTDARVRGDLEVALELAPAAEPR